MLLTLSCGLIYSQVKFDSIFESGNINTVTKVDSNYYEIRTREDIGGRWFYFRISGVQNKHIKVKILNSDVNRPFYSYDNKAFQRFSSTEAPFVNYFEKTFEQDTVFVSYYTPYTFSRLTEKISEWKLNSNVFVDTIGYTQMNLPMQEMIVTDSFTPNDNKIGVWIHARTHPGETPSSFQFEGIMNELLKENDAVDYYRENIVFHLIPFTNPDGVYYGRSRTNFNGVDVEREWNKPMDETSLEAQAMKKRMIEINSKKVISLFLNLHSQAASYCTFWIHSAQSTSDRFYRMENQFANLNTSDNPYFAPSDYSESNLRDYFPEGFLWNTQGEKVMALTYETPYDQYSNDEWVTDDNLVQIGRRTFYASMEYLGLSHPKRIIIDNANAVLKGNWTVDSSGLEFYGDNFITADGGLGENRVTFQTENIQPGKYDIYGWWPSSDNFAYNTEFTVTAGGAEIQFEKTQKTNGGQWNFLAQTNMVSTGKIAISISDSAAGKVAADAFRILYAGLPTFVESASKSPSDFQLYQNYPNPFNPSTTISFYLSKSEPVRLTIYNILGKRIALLINEEMNAGLYNAEFNPRTFNLSSGVYIYTLSVGRKSVSKKMTYLK